MTWGLTLIFLSQWSEVQQILNGTPCTYQDCPVEEGRDTDHWLRPLDLPGEEPHVHVELQLTVRTARVSGKQGPLGLQGDLQPPVHGE